MQRYARRREPDFAGRHECRNGVAELREPAARVHPVFGPGPAAELLAVIHEHGERTARLPQLTEVGADLRRRPEGNEIAEPLVDRKQPDALAAALGQKRRMQPVPLESTHEKEAGVHEQITYAPPLLLRGFEIGKAHR